MGLGADAGAVLAAGVAAAPGATPEAPDAPAAAPRDGASFPPRAPVRWARPRVCNTQRGSAHPSLVAWSLRAARRPDSGRGRRAKGWTTKDGLIAKGPGQVRTRARPNGFVMVRSRLWCGQLESNNGHALKPWAIRDSADLEARRLYSLGAASPTHRTPRHSGACRGGGCFQNAVPRLPFLCGRSVWA